MKMKRLLYDIQAAYTSDKRDIDLPCDQMTANQRAMNRKLALTQWLLQVY